MPARKELDAMARRYRELGLGRGRIGFGRRPAVLLVDAQEGFVGDGPLACGEDGPRAQDAMQRLLEAARAAGVAVLYTRNLDPPEGFGEPLWRLKKPAKTRMREGSPVGEIAGRLRPRQGDVVVVKYRPSAFFDTPVETLLRGAEVDTLIVCGATTSGCVRATVVDAFSRDFRVIVPEECVCDRVESSHVASLADMDAKYADVLPLEEVVRHLEGFGKRDDGPAVSI